MPEKSEGETRAHLRFSEKQLGEKGRERETFSKIREKKLGVKNEGEEDEDTVGLVFLVGEKYGTRVHVPVRPARRYTHACTHDTSTACEI